MNDLSLDPYVYIERKKLSERGGSMSVSLTYRILGSFMVKPTKLERIIFTVMMTMDKVRTEIYLPMTYKFSDSFQKVLNDKPGFLMVEHVTLSINGHVYAAETEHRASEGVPPSQTDDPRLTWTIRFHARINR